MKPGWRSGPVDRERLPRAVHRWSPAHVADGLTHISLDELQAVGKRLILLDVDHTLVPWKGEDFLPEVENWIADAKRRGFHICILSNTRRPARLMRLAQRLGVEVVRDKFKPNPAMYRLALEKFGASPEEAVMIGDQLFTDIWGANRCGIDAIWVHRHDPREFIGTRVISRNLEKLVQGSIWGAVATDGSHDPPEVSTRNQLIRFLIVGGTAFFVDYNVRMTLMYALPVGRAIGRRVMESGLFVPSTGDPLKAAFPVIATIAWAVATFVAFYLNRLWTFRAVGRETTGRQMGKYYAGALGALVINTLVSMGVMFAFGDSVKSTMRVATVVGAMAGAVWNFLVQKFFTFRKPT